MAHVPRTTIHAFQNRPLSILIDVDTALTPGDLTGTVFQVADVTVATFAPTAGGAGLEISVALSTADLTIAPGVYGWECRATVGGAVIVIAAGLFQLAAEPTAA